MADPGKVWPSDLTLLKREIEVLGELISSERLDRKAEVDRLKLEIEALKCVIEQLKPGALAEYQRAYEQRRHTYDPETETDEEPELGHRRIRALCER
jgi:hypothetical protein